MEILSIKDYATVAVATITIITAVFTFIKFVYPKIKSRYTKDSYLYNTGFHIVNDIEKSFGKDAGNALRKLLETLHHKMDVKDVRLDIIENALSIGIYLCGSDGKVTYVNRTLSDMFGMDKEKMMGLGWLSPVVERETAFKRWDFAIKNQIPYSDTYNVEIDGKAYTYKTEAEPSIRDGIILGYVGVVKRVDIPNS
jgi:PAS domain S-box-containing protein